MSFDKIIYKLTDQRIPAATGIGLVGDILYNADFQKQFGSIKTADKRSRKQIDCGTVLTSFIALLCIFYILTLQNLSFYDGNSYKICYVKFSSLYNDKCHYKAICNSSRRKLISETRSNTDTPEILQPCKVEKQTAIISDGCRFIYINQGSVQSHTRP